MLAVALSPLTRPPAVRVRRWPNSKKMAPHPPRVPREQEQGSSCDRSTDFRIQELPASLRLRDARGCVTILAGSAYFSEVVRGESPGSKMGTGPGVRQTSGGVQFKSALLDDRPAAPWRIER